MLNLNVSDLKKIILRESNVSEQALEKMVSAKMDALSGLISQEGALHIIANEMGINVYKGFEGSMKLKDVVSGMRSLETNAKILAVYELREFTRDNKQGKVANALIGDETGALRLVGWGSKADVIAKLKVGDIIKINSAYTKLNQGKVEIHLNDSSTITINPAGINIEVTKTTTKGVRKNIGDLSEKDSNVELLGTIVQAFEPRFFEVCPQCSKRARMQGDVFACEEHGPVTPDYSYVTNIVLDDGTGNIRVVCFRQQTESLLNKPREQIIEMKDNPALFAVLKDDLIGTLVKLTGRVSNNAIFNRIEFVSQSVDRNPDPEEELQRLNSSE